MAFSFDEHTTANGTSYAYTFDAVTHNTTNIKVTIGGKHLYDGVTKYNTNTRLPDDNGSVQSVEYTLTGDSTGGTITINSNVNITGVVTNGVPTLSSNQILRIFRQTNRLTPEVSFSSDSVLTDTDLNKSNNQARFLSLEAVDRADESISIDANNSARYNVQIEGANKRIFGIADPVDDSDAVNRGFITTNLTKITEVEAIKTQVTQVANLENGTTATNAITNVAGKTAEIGRLGTPDAVADMVLLGTQDVVDDLALLAHQTVKDDMALLADNAVITDMGILGTNENVSNMDTCADNINNVNAVALTVAGSQTYVVTVTNPGSGNVFVLDGTNNPAITLTKGFTYTFDQSHSSNSGHTLKIRDDDDNEYTNGVTLTGTPGQSGAKTVFVVPANAPTTGLRYYCVAHLEGMGNTITTANNDLGEVASIGASNLNTVATNAEGTSLALAIALG